LVHGEKNVQEKYADFLMKNGVKNVMIPSPKEKVIL
jgi:hypothetical protein